MYTFSPPFHTTSLMLDNIDIPLSYHSANAIWKLLIRYTGSNYMFNCMLYVELYEPMFNCISNFTYFSLKFIL